MREAFTRFVECARTLNLAREQGIMAIGIHDSSRGHPGSRREMHQMEPVITGEPKIRDQKLEWCSKQLYSRGLELEVPLQIRYTRNAVVKECGQILVWFDQEDVSQHLNRDANLSQLQCPRC